MRGVEFAADAACTLVGCGGSGDELSDIEAWVVPCLGGRRDLGGGCGRGRGGVNFGKEEEEEKWLKFECVYLRVFMILLVEEVNVELGRIYNVPCNHAKFGLCEY